MVDPSDDPLLRALDDGERSAISLGLSVSADLILIDDRKGAVAARSKGLEVTGTLGILDLAAHRSSSDISGAASPEGLGPLDNRETGIN